MKKSNQLLFSEFNAFWKSKFWLTMRITLILILTSVLQVMATGSYSQSKINLSLKNVTVKQVLESIEDNSEYFFMYDASNLDLSQKIDFHTEDEEIEKVLDKLFKGKGIKYQINNRLIALKKIESPRVSNQSIRIRGKVVNAVFNV